MPSHSNTLSIDVMDMVLYMHDMYICVVSLSKLAADEPRSLNVYACELHERRFEEDLAINARPHIYAANDFHLFTIYVY